MTDQPRRKFDPRKRQAAVQKKYEGISPSRIAWCLTTGGSWRLIEKRPLEHHEMNPGSGIVIRAPSTFGRYAELFITSLTEAEFVAVRELWTLAFDLALPVIKERDRIAHEAAKQGLDDNARSYRAAPQFIVRARAKYLHDLSLQGRSDYVSPPDAEDGSDGGGVRGAGDGVADEVPEDAGPEDDQPETE